MIEPAHIVGYGRPATAALAQSIADAQASGPLEPVTVIVSSNFVGLSVRRLLGGGVLANDAAAHRGLANVSFVTPFRLVELITRMDSKHVGPWARSSKERKECKAS